jgi:uncharacterized protein YjiS (DUF1127 family)
MEAEMTHPDDQTQTIWHRAAKVLSRMGDAALNAQRRKALSALDAATLKDIGWPCVSFDTRNRNC